MPSPLVTILADAYRARRELDWATLPAPADLPAATAAQAELVGMLGGGFGGWKVGAGPDGTSVAAPILSALVLASGGVHPLPPQGRSAIEVEIGVRLGQDLPARSQGYSRDEILAACDAVMIGIEIVESRLTAFQKAPYPLFVADLMANRGYVIGESVAVRPEMALEALRCTVSVDGKVVHDAPGGHAKGDPMQPLVAYASRPNDRLGGLRRGQFVTTGTLCGVLAIGAPARIAATIEGIGAVTLSMT